MTYSLSQIATIIGATAYISSPATIHVLLTDSRSLTFPDETLFFAITTTKGSGIDYIPQLYHRGVRNFVTTTLPHGIDLSQVNVLIVPDTLAALQQLAQYHRQQYDIPVIAITGSNGKTIVKEWLNSLLTDTHHITRSPKSYNSQIGVPLSLALLDDSTTLAIIEAGISQPHEMARLQTMIQPTIGILTSLGTAHQENFTSMHHKCCEKLTLFTHADAVITTSDNDIIREALTTLPPSVERVTWSKKDPTATLFVRQLSQTDTTTTIYAVYQHTDITFTIPFTTEAEVNNALSAALAALTLHLPPTVLAQRTPRLETIDMRLHITQGIRNITIINDAYNNDLNALSLALNALARRQDNHSTLILSDILHTGIPPETLYQHVNDLLIANNISTFIGIGNDLYAQQDLLTIPDKHLFHSTQEFLSSTMSRTIHDTTLLLKGARPFHFEDIAQRLTQKVHLTTLEVNLNAIVHNLNIFRQRLLPTTKITCMIKADGYGTGAIELAQVLQEQNVDYLAVALADEGRLLRQQGITQQIMVMNPEEAAFTTIFNHHLEPEVYSFRLLRQLIITARRLGIKHYPIHIKLDTGMLRLGFNPATDLPELISILTTQTELTPRSIFSHLAEADDDHGFTQQQHATFLAAAQLIQHHFTHKILLHICNTAGILRFPHYQHDMVRLGIGLYGINPTDDTPLRTVATLTTTILQIRSAHAGDTVGYNRRTTLTRDSSIAIIPIGYADGLDRHLGNRHAYALVNNLPAPYVGNICMDTAMLDVTDIPCHEGDRVDIFSQQLPITTLAHTLNTIPYEILTSLSTRINRVYIRD